MRTVHFRSVAIAATGVITSHGSTEKREHPSRLRRSAKASTPAEHHALEEYFLTLAKRYTAEANEHVTLAQTYRGTRIAWAAVHHDRLAGLARDSSKEAAADMHKPLANITL